MSRDRDKLDGDVYYDRPVRGKLHVHLENGDVFEARPDDLRRWGYINGLTAYLTFTGHLGNLLDEHGLLARDVTSSELNAVRYIVELATRSPDLLDHPDIGEVNQQIVEIERWLQKRVKLTEEMAQLVRSWESNAYSLRDEAANSKSISDAHRRDLTSEAEQWEGAAKALRDAFDLPANPS